MKDDEGNAAAAELFPYNSRQNYILYTTGNLVHPQSKEVIEYNKTEVDLSLIPKKNE